MNQSYEFLHDSFRERSRYVGMIAIVNAIDTSARHVLARLDAALNRLYGWRGNPVYQSGALTVALLLLLIGTGLYLLLFYRVGSPYESVGRITEQVWVGRWVRGLHRYAADAAVVAAALHAFRLFAQGRRWGPRALAWISGVVLFGLILVCGWTGYVMVWDTFGQVLAIEGARLMDLLPLFSEPIGRAFTGERALGGAFFFLNLFLHIALPIGLGIVLWLHVSRVARPTLLPPRRLMWSTFALLTAAAILLPVGLAPEATPFLRPARVPADLFYAFWLPLTEGAPAWMVWLTGGALVLAVLIVPWWSRPAPARQPPKSLVDERLCTGCRQCSLDCPYEAIEMLPRTDGRADVVAHVHPALCVSCGICAGSCAPMGVGPPGRTGRDQLERVRAFVAERRPGPADLVVVACTRGAGGVASSEAVEGNPVLPVQCIGNLHTSVIEYLIRTGVGGVLVAGCQVRDCWNREGPKWLEERLYHDREAELKERVDRRRVSLAHAGLGERAQVLEEIRRFHERIRALAVAPGESAIDLLLLCEPVEAGTADSAGSEPAP
jgi:coenzyme F420-reducing hydrogenase delta subunit/Pyruvate/2-oxoacid:ferredoxin oxidoreductase delta subunit